MDIRLVHRGIEITVLDGPYVVDGKATPDAITYYTDLIERLDELRTFTSAALLRLYNETWLTEDIGVLDRTTFARRLANPSIHLYDEVGAAIVYFDDGDMFGGHFIEVSIRDGTPTHATLVG
jgi:hypothetical protein